MTDPIAGPVSAALDRLWRGGPLGLAVSGGGDSKALMLIAADWAGARGAELRIATVDHGLRPESADEAAAVVADAAALGLPHQTLGWTEWDGRGNLQAAARSARRGLLAAWARAEGVEAVLLGHTLDDQAETVLMRLGRGAGVDGLSAMTEASEAEGVRWLRPMLGARREGLRDWLRDRGATWFDDPSNENEAFDRIKARRALAALADLGVTAEGLSATADRMQAAREALDHAAEDIAASAAVWGRCGELTLALEPLRKAPPELARRLLRAGLMRASGAEYGPRAEAERGLMSAMLSLRLGGGRSLHGCLIRPKGVGHVVIARESAGLDPSPQPAAPERLWDGRFRITAVGAGKVAPLGPKGAARLKALGEAGGWTAPAHWMAAPAAARIATPAYWRGDDLVAAPLAGHGDALQAEFAGAGPRWFATGAAAAPH